MKRQRKAMRGGRKGSKERKRKIIKLKKKREIEEGVGESMSEQIN